MTDSLEHTQRKSLTFGLWFLIVSLAVLAPVISIGNLQNELSELKRTDPDVAQTSAFKIHLAWIWASVLTDTALGMTIAGMLYKVRVKKTLSTAAVLLWVRFAIGFALMLVAHLSSGSEMDPSIGKDLQWHVSWLFLWTFYLLQSKKVQAIYQ